jgi:hypothetical protein
MLYLAWRFGGHDPYKLFYGMDDFYRLPGSDESIPPGTDRVKWLIYGFAELAEEDESARAGAQVARSGM